jgi:tRNA threonylcarbamoyladenosine biosynthesis protein TsaB
VKILAIDTATEACSAALWLDGEVRERFVEQPRGHGELILGMMETLLAEADLTLRDLDALAFGRGPGAFTGVRIAVGVAQGVGLGARLPLVPVSNLAILAQRLYRERGVPRCLAALDARMGELYLGVYRIEAGIAHGVMPERLGVGADLPLPSGGGWHGVGRGWAVQEGTRLAARLGPALVGCTPEVLCSAADMGPLAAAALASGDTVRPEEALPDYLRERVAWKQGAP